MAIRLVTFDALHTIITPRLPIYVQYSQTFEPYLGVLDPDALKRSFNTALKQVQHEQPVYRGGAEEWWGDVIRRTAIGAGADAQAVDGSVGEIVPRLLKRFSSREGYKLFDDTLPTFQRLRQLNVRIGVISNTDARMRAVIEDLGVMHFLDTLLLSEEEGIEKPSCEIFQRACERLSAKPEETMHVGDELDCDYQGAKACGLQALLVRRPGPEGEEERKEAEEILTGVQVIPGLLSVLDRVQGHATR
ncbi:HAD hydrolase subfamily IA REG-2-like protein [Dichomitus squalens LYAD-421 SS1]|uniref:HAD hydrolase subfamily IA REG-2-like protein n=1 Tax=Dichomitus squalens (strain LYAD-421) TaxID=732165 RepID=UPI0004412915|nr:HAD hydrolase subfamily IA REG-2-like protein [Dichomitus squalens LYAD-421 SS1]EJF65084.1 HAD hydrolase subfamily IA REG-2-like protein [Dichomitus squalens LYAD-421 SS1]